MRRRRRSGSPPKPFDDAFGLIDKLEMSVVTRMVVPDFTVQQALLALYDDDTVFRLQAAWPLIRDQYRGSFISERVIIPAVGATAITATVTISGRHAKMLVPEAGSAKMDRVLNFQPLVSVIQDSHEQHLRFEKVRAVVRWLNTHATPGAARHYCPWLTSILPTDHPFQKVDGQIYREPAVGIGEIMPIMRECSAIMASALLAGDPNVTSDKNRFMVSFNGQRETEAYTSQQFGLI